jgi:hypothetical protein
MTRHALSIVFALAACSDKGDDSSGGAGNGEGPEAPDADHDGYDVTEDCDDGDPAINPGATEICDGVDNDCADGIDVNATDATDYFVDADADGYGTGTATPSCDAVGGRVSNGDDCDDFDPLINPAATEVCDELDTDEDCDHLADDADDSVDPTTATVMVHPDEDGDGHGAPGAKVAACDPGPASTDDCDDTNAAIYPLAPETCDDAVDDDCDGVADACRFSGEIDPMDADAHLIGDEEFLSFGYDVSPAGDMNGDGVGDMAVAAGRNGFVFDGPIGGTISASDALAHFEETKSGEPVAEDVQGIGDQQGDGYDDLVVGSGSATGWTGVQSGVAYIVLGPVSGVASIDAVADATVTGDGHSGLGWGLSAGDVNGDGVSDSIFGAPDAAQGSFSTYGAAYVFFGPVTSGELTPEDASAAFTGLNLGEYTGRSNAANGDVNADGVDDLLVSSVGFDYGWSTSVGSVGGAAYLFYGPVSGTHPVSDADTRFVNGVETGELGAFCALGGDVDGDGSSDVALSAPGIGGGDGAVYVVYSSQVPSVDDFDVTKAGATVVGDPDSSLGFHLDTAGDLDSDGNDDLTIGSYMVNTAWTYYGPISGSVEATADASFVVTAAVWPYLRIGVATVFVGDVTGDGADDLAIGADGYSPGKGEDKMSRVGAVLLLNGTAP